MRRQSLHPCLSDMIWILFPADAVMFFTSTRQAEAYSTSQGREELGRLRHLIGTYGEKRLPRRTASPLAPLTGSGKCPKNGRGEGGLFVFDMYPGREEPGLVCWSADGGTV